MPIDSVGFPEKVHDAFTWQTFTKDENAKYGRAHPDNTRLEGEWRYTTLMPTVFPLPHVCAGARPHVVSEPEARRRRMKSMSASAWRWRPRFMTRWATAASNGSPRSIAFFDKVNAEDKFVVEGIAVGSRSPLGEARSLELARARDP